MATMNISLPKALKRFVDEQVVASGYGTMSEFVRELIRHEQDRIRLRNLLLEGARSRRSGPADAAYFNGLREGIRARSVPVSSASRR